MGNIKDQTVLYLGAQSCPTLCDPMTVACQAPLAVGILQARILELIALQGLFPTQVSRNTGGFFTV